MIKISKTIDELNNQQVDAAWVTTPLNVYYFTGYRSELHERLFALLTKKDGKQVLPCPKMEVEEVKASPFTGEIVGYLDTENPFSLYPQTINRLLIESEHLAVTRQKQLVSGFNVNSPGDVDLTIKQLRDIKSEDEINKIRKAVELVDKCIKIGVSHLKESVTRREVVNYIEQIIKQYGVNEMGFDTMVLFGDHAASPHGTPGDRRLKSSGYALFDLGVIYERYCSDMARTIKSGESSQEAQEIYNIVLKAETSAIQVTKPGIPLKDIDHIARNIIPEKGYGEYFLHRLGHGLGLQEHEYQDIPSTNSNLLEADMVTTIGPGIYVPGVVGVRVEDDILVTNEGYEVLIHYEK